MTVRKGLILFFAGLLQVQISASQLEVKENEQPRGLKYIEFRMPDMMPQVMNTPPPNEQNWHAAQSENLKLIRNFIEEHNGQQNVATFHITILKGEKILATRDFSNTFFISGNDMKSNIEADWELFGNQPAAFKCISDYCPVLAGKPSDYGLRKEIIEFFDFKEKLTSSEKKILCDIYKNLLKSGGMFEDLILSEKSIIKLTETYASTLEGRFFSEQSNTLAREYKLSNKAKRQQRIASQAVQVSADELFSTESFYLNFADSEQSIRLFIGDIDLNFNLETNNLAEELENNKLFTKYCVDFNDLSIQKGKLEDCLKKLQDEEKKCLSKLQNLAELFQKNKSKIKSMQKNSDHKNASVIGKMKAEKQLREDKLKKQEEELEQKQKQIEVENRKINDNLYDISRKIECISEDIYRDFIIIKIKSFLEGIKIQLDIASYLDMCLNCQATFRHEVSVKKQIHLKIFNSIIKEYLKSLGNAQAIFFTSKIESDDEPYANLKKMFLNDFYISLFVSGLKEYTS